MGVTRTFLGGSGKDDGEEILIWTYTDDAAGGAKDLLIESKAQDGNTGFIIPGKSTQLICALKNTDGDPITWEDPPKWKGSNDPDLVNPTISDGFNLTIGDGKVVDQAFTGSLTAGEEQCTIIDCAKAPRIIWMQFDPPAQNLDLSLFVRENYVP